MLNGSFGAMAAQRYCGASGIVAASEWLRRAIREEFWGASRLFNANDPGSCVLSRRCGVRARHYDRHQARRRESGIFRHALVKRHIHEKRGGRQFVVGRTTGNRVRAADGASLRKPRTGERTVTPAAAAGQVMRMVSLASMKWRTASSKLRSAQPRAQADSRRCGGVEPA